MLIVATAWYPPTKQPEVTRAYIEAMKKYPPKPFEKVLVRSAIRQDKDGVIVLNVIDVEKGKFEEAYNHWVKVFLEFGNIEGYRHRIEAFLTEQEAFAIIGMTPPK